MSQHLLVVYTAHFGQYESQIRAKPLTDSGIPSFCFTDDASSVPTGFSALPAASPSDIVDFRLMNRWHKLFGGRFFKDSALFTVYIDANIEIVDVALLLDLIHWCEVEDAEFVVWKHPTRSNWRDELRAAQIRGGGMTRRAAKHQHKAYSELGFANHNGLYQNGLIIRRTNCAAVQRLEDVWWEHLLHFSPRDQVSLPVVAELTGTPIRLIPLAYSPVPSTSLLSHLQNSHAIRVLWNLVSRWIRPLPPYHENSLVRVWRH